jgi:photosystem II stability/assembly factor-like uncharacterized protein
MRKELIYLICAVFTVVGCNDSEPAADWKRVDISTDADLNVVSFIDETVGFIGAVQKSPLSRAQYSFQDRSYYDYINGVHINSDSTKYHYVEFSTPDPEPILFRTTDGGDTWREMSAPFVSGVVDISFLDEFNGYVMTSEEGLFKTTNGGLTWKRVLSNIAFLGNQRIEANPFQKIHFYDSLEGIAFHKFKSAVVKTVDGGKNWSIIPSFDVKCIGCGLSDVVFPNGSATGFAVYNGTQLFKTVDAGNTWNSVIFTAQYHDSGVAFHLDNLVFIDEQNGFVLNGGTPYLTVDGGQTWTKVADRPLAAEKLLIREKDKLYLQYYEHFSYWNTSTHEYRSFTAEGGSSITDWCFAGKKAFAVGPRGMLLKLDAR